MSTPSSLRRPIGGLHVWLGLILVLAACTPAPGPSSQESAGFPGEYEIEGPPPPFSVKSLDAGRQSVRAVLPNGGGEVEIGRGVPATDGWTLMAVVNTEKGLLAVFEDFESRAGDLVFMSEAGVEAFLPKSLEGTHVPAGTLYGGRSLDELIRHPRDVLAEEVLARPGDPSYDKVAPYLAPLRAPTFVGTRHSVDKPTFDYGAFSDEIYVDVGKVFPEIAAARRNGDVSEGLVGGWLPVPRFLFPAGENRYWDVVIFAEENPSRFWTQPLWFRILLVENDRVAAAHHFYHHLPYPPRGEPDARLFYEALWTLREAWRRDLVPGMRIEVPDPRIRDFCLHSLVREMITRVGDHPKYGYPPLGGINIFGGYGYSNVDTFQDTFNTSVNTFLEWGQFDIARRYVDDYFTESVREDGSIDTRGPEIGQYGNMLTTLARYYEFTRDAALMDRHLPKILAIADLLRGLWAESRRLPADDPAYGILSGWSEHDSCLKEDPYSLVLPYYSNSAHAARGFLDLGRALTTLGGAVSNSELASKGEDLARDGAAMRRDLENAVRKGIVPRETGPYLPPIAGDPTAMHFRGRAYSESLHSGMLPSDGADAVLSVRGGRNVSLLNRGGFLFYGTAYGLLHRDKVREFLLAYYANMAHGHTRGTWTAVEGSAFDGERPAPYATPAQLNVPILTKWLLVFEEPVEPVLWLAKATPAEWLEDGKRIVVDDAPTRFGRIGYTLTSNIEAGKVSASVRLPEKPVEAEIRLRLRVPGGRQLREVKIDGRDWENFDPGLGTVRLPPGARGTVELDAVFTPGSGE